MEKVRRGAPCGNANALKHGKYTRERRALFAGIRAHIRQGRALVAEVMRAVESGCSEMPGVEAFPPSIMAALEAATHRASVRER